jgi:predicted permease
MSWIDAVRYRLRTLLDREQLAREMEEEMRFHVEQHARHEGDEHRPSDARAKARRRLRHVPSLVDDRRQASGLAGLDRVLQDVRYAGRQLVRAPGFTLAVILTLALGVGANVTMFAIVDRVMLRAPDGIANPDAVWQLRSWRELRSGRDSSGAMSFPSYAEFRAMTDAFESVTAARGPMDVAVDRGPTAENARGMLVADDYFQTLGVRPQLGRFFLRDETNERSGAAVAVLGHDYWQRRYAGDPAVVGQTLFANATTFTIIGVAPRAFSGHTLSAVDFWLPIAATPGLRMGRDETWASERGNRWLATLVRLRPDMSTEQALARVSLGWTAWNVSPERTEVAAPTPFLVSLIPAESSSRPEHQVARLLTGVAILLLLITCANVANLLLARALSRRREVAIRLALGVGRSRLTILFLADALLLAMLASGAALAVAWIGIPTVRAVLFAGTNTATWPLDGRLVLFTVVTSLSAGAIAGIVPALQATRPALIAALRQGTREGAVHRSRTRLALLIAQGALSVALLAGTGLFVRSLQQIGDQHLGLDLNRVLVADFPRRETGFSSETERLTYETMRKRARTIPGVESVSFTVGVPLEGQYALPLRIPGHDSIPGMPKGRAPFLYAVTPDFFQTMGTRLLAGRSLTESDFGGPAVAVVNATMARTIWPGGDAIGQCFKIELRSPTPDCIQVVGIVEDVRRSALLETEASPQYYVPLGQQPALMSELTLLVRATNAERVLPTVRRALQSVRDDMPYVNVRTLEDAVAPELRPWRLGASVFALFGILALIVATVGTYSVMQFSVSQRTHELGVRIALGATRGNLLGLVTRESVQIGVVASLAGVLVVLLTGGLVESMLFQTSPRDPYVLGAVTLVLLVSGLLASMVPAWRATRVDPVATLKAE